MTGNPKTTARDHTLGPAKRVVFWAITLVGPVLLVFGLLELGLRLVEPGRRPIAPETLNQRLQESARTEVRVVATGNLRGLIQPSTLPDVVYELKPSRHWVFKGAATSTNGQGMRGEEIVPEKPPGVLRVAGIGDSVMFGWGVDQADIYMSLLPRLLSTSRRPVEVLNFAVPGYNSTQEAALLRGKVWSFSPDILLVNYCSNDWVAPFFVVDPKLGGIIESSLLFQNIRARLVPGVGEDFLNSQMGMNKVRAALSEIAKAASERGIPVLFFTYPETSNPDERAMAERLARENRFVYVDLYEPLSRYVQDHHLEAIEAMHLAPNDTHPNAAAHQVMAETLAREIRSVMGLSGQAPANGGPLPPGPRLRAGERLPAHNPN